NVGLTCEPVNLLAEPRSEDRHCSDATSPNQVFLPWVHASDIHHDYAIGRDRSLHPHPGSPCGMTEAGSHSDGHAAKGAVPTGLWGIAIAVSVEPHQANSRTSTISLLKTSDHAW